MCLLGPGIVSQETAISGSFQQNLASVCNGVSVWRHWKERPIGHANFICPSTGERLGQKGEVGGLEEWGWVGIGDFWYSIGNVNELNT
jgi:hypothetical protein